MSSYSLGSNKCCDLRGKDHKGATEPTGGAQGAYIRGSYSAIIFIIIKY